MSQERIQVDYDHLVEIARRFGGQSDEVGEWLQNIRSGMDRLRGGGWSGAGADAFFNEMEHEVLPGMDRLTRALDQAQGIAQQISRTMETAEQEAAGFFQKDGAASGIDTTGGDGSGAGVEGGLGGITGAAIGGTPGGSVHAGGGTSADTSGSWGQVSKQDYDWVNWRREMGEKTTNLIITAVGKKFKIAAKLITLIKTGVSIAFDEDASTNLWRDVIGELPKLGVKLALGTALTVPLLISDLFQLGAHGIEGGLAWAGNPDAANWLHNAANHVDVNWYLEEGTEMAFDEIGKIPDRIHQAVEDFKQDWERIAPIVQWKFPELGKILNPWQYGF